MLTTISACADAHVTAVATSPATARARAPKWLLRLALSGLWGLTACGDGTVIAETWATTPAPVTAQRAGGQDTKRDTLTPLFDSIGRALPSARHLVPSNTAERTRPGLYATQAQLQWQELVAGDTTIVLDLDRLESVQTAIHLGHQVHYWRDPKGLAYFVRGGRAADAAQVVNALSDEGVAPIFLVR
jgi:hypothetical protein